MKEETKKDHIQMFLRHILKQGITKIPYLLNDFDKLYDEWIRDKE